MQESLLQHRRLLLAAAVALVLLLLAARVVLPAGTTHFALHWRRSPGARIVFRLSRDGRRFGRVRSVLLDELAEGRGGREVYGSVTLARGARAVRVLVSRPVRRVSVLTLREGHSTRAAPVASAASISQPPIVLRAGWGADERLRFDSSGKETWPPAFYPVQKLIVHHTATQNDDPDPAATIRSIYYYHAVTQGWGDIGYNFLIDESGRIYEGRHTIDYPLGASPTEEDSRGYGVTAAHAYGYNSGTIGIAYNDRGASNGTLYGAALAEGMPGSLAKTTVSTDPQITPATPIRIVRT